MTIRRSSRRSSASIPLGLLNDQSLTWKARGLAAFILSKPDSWRIDSVALARLGADGRDAVRSGLKELREAGYLLTTRRQNEGGQWVTESVLFEDRQGEPETGFPASGFPASDNPEPTPENPTSGKPAVGRPGAIPLLVDEEVQRDKPMAASQPAVSCVFDAWLKSTGRTTRTQLDPKRRRAIEKALKMYPLDDVLDAVDGWRYSSHHAGQNDRREIYNEVTLLLRDAAHIERFRDLRRSSRRPFVEIGAPEAAQPLVEADQELQEYLRRKDGDGHGD